MRTFPAPRAPRPVLVGLDPGVHVGLAVAQLGKLVEVKTLSFWEAVASLQVLMTCHPALHVFIEDPNANRPVFFKRGADSAAKIQKVAQNVGANKRDAQLLIEWVQRQGLPLTAVPPRASKLSPEGFERITGWKARCSQHGRDAAMLVLGR